MHTPPHSTLFPYTTLFRSNISELAGGNKIQAVTSALSIARDGKVPTSYNFNLGIQRVLPRHTLLDVSYVGTIANHRSEEHTSELQSPYDIVCRLLLEKKKI